MSQYKLIDIPTLLRDADQTPLVSADYAYTYVPWYHRAVTLRAQTISAMPYAVVGPDGNPITSPPPLMPGLFEWLPRMLYMAEMARCMYGAAYFLLETNLAGMNITPRYLPPPGVFPKWDRQRVSITEYQVTGLGRIEPERILRSWLPHPASETQPGPAPGQVALHAAGLLSALDEMVTLYFRRGATPLTLVRVPPSVPQQERSRIEYLLTMAASGLRNFARYLTVSKNVEMSQVGANLKETLATELIEAQRDNVAAAFGLPPSVIDGTAANYATAQSDMIGAYLYTFIPAAQAIAADVTSGLLARAGLRLELQVDQLEIMQTIQLSQAQALTQLAGQPIMTVDEAREWLGLPLLPAREQPQIIDVEQAKRWRSRALELVRAGSVPVVGSPYDGELSAASTPGMVRAVFERHWPRANGNRHDDALTLAARELARYNDYLEERYG